MADRPNMSINKKLLPNYGFSDEEDQTHVIKITTNQPFSNASHFFDDTISMPCLKILI